MWSDLIDVMSLGDVVVLGGIHLGPMIVASAVLTVAFLPSSRTKRTYVAVCVAGWIVLAGACANVWFWWGTGFGLAVSAQAVPSLVDRDLVVSLWIVVAAVFFVSLLGVAAFHGRQKSIAGR
jgi:hypothetical protein